jgi:hypothetical protein
MEEEQNKGSSEVFTLPDDSFLLTDSEVTPNPQSEFTDTKESLELDKSNQEQPKESNLNPLLPEWLDDVEDRSEKNDLHLAQNFDVHSGCISYSLLRQQKEIFVISSDKRLENIAKLKRYYNIIGYPYEFMSKNAVYSFLKGETIDIKQMFEEVRNIFQQYIIALDDRHFDLFSLYVILTYCFTCFPTIPYLWVSAEKGSGKTTLLQVFNSLVFHPSLSSSSTVSSIFRLIDSNKNTLLLDEAESLSSSNTENREVMSVLCSGYQFNGAVIRSEKINDTWIPKSFNTFSPKILASIGGIREPLASRCVKIRLLRKKKNEKVQRFKIDPTLDDQLSKIKNKIYQGILSNFTAIISTQNIDWSSKADLNNRELDLWEPVFTLATVIDEHKKNNDSKLGLLTKMIKLAEELSAVARSIDESPIVQLAKSLIDGIKSRGIEPVNLKKYPEFFDRRDVFHYLTAIPQFAWCTSLKALTTYLQNKLGIQTRKATFDKGQIRCYFLKQEYLEDMIERYAGDDVDEIEGMFNGRAGINTQTTARREQLPLTGLRDTELP